MTTFPKYCRQNIIPLLMLFMNLLQRDCFSKLTLRAKFAKHARLTCRRLGERCRASGGVRRVEDRTS